MTSMSVTRIHDIIATLVGPTYLCIITTDRYHLHNMYMNANFIKAMQIQIMI